MSDSQIRTIERFFDMIAQPAITAVLNSALRLGVVDALESGQRTALEIASMCSINPQGAQSLLQVLVTTGMVERFEEHYALSQAARLTPRAMWAMTFEQWTDLESALKQESEEPESMAFERERHQQERYERFRAAHSQIQWAATGVALKLCEALGIGSERQFLNILDLGCGAAVYSMAIAHRDPEARVHLVDDARGLARAKTTIESLEAEDRVETTESADLVFPGHHDTFDLVVAGDRIHLWHPDWRKRILNTALRTLKPGGELAVVDVFAGQSRGMTHCHLFQLQMLTGTGRTPLSLGELNEVLKAAGFCKIQYTDLPVPPYTHGLVLAARPADESEGINRRI